MIEIPALTDSTGLIGDPAALRAQWRADGVVFLRGVLDRAVIDWAREKFRGALAAEGLIDLAQEAPVWTGVAPQTRRPCDALGTMVWHELIKQPVLNAVMRDIFDGTPAWIPIAAHRSSLPTGPVADDEDIFSGRHQDSYYNEGMQFAVCWMPIRDVDLNSGSFAVAPGSHRHGLLHSEAHDHGIPPGVIPEESWRSADFRAGDVLIFHYHTAHATLPNPSNQIRMSLDVRAVPTWAPQPVIGTVERVDGNDVTILQDNGAPATVHISEQTLIRDMNPRPRIVLAQLQRIAHPGARVMAMVDSDQTTTVIRRNFY